MQVIRIVDGVVELQEVSEVKRARLTEFFDALVLQRGVFTPVMPAGTVHFAARDRFSTYTIELPPQRRTVRFRPKEGREQEHSIPMPWTLFLITFCAEALDSLRIFVRPKPLASTTDLLHQVCFPNRGSDGVTCMGNFKFEISAQTPDKIRAAIEFYWSARFTSELLESFDRQVPDAIAVKTGTKENWFHGWARLSDEDLTSVLWKPYKPLSEVVQHTLERR